MAVAAGAGYWLLTDDQFRVDDVELTSDVRYASVSNVLESVGLAADARPNVFELRTDEMRDIILAVPGIAHADVRAALPNRVIVSISERPAVLVLERSEGSYVINGDGVVLARIAPADGAELGLPTVNDRRAQWAPEAEVGATFDPTDLEALLQLGALVPETIGSRARGLTLTVDDENGYVLRADTDGWQAVFGHYTPTLRPPEIVARQVQCLRSLIAQDEAALEIVYLAPLDERCGTFLPTPGPRASPTPEPRP